jgi:hypothetical protein
MTILRYFHNSSIITYVEQEEEEEKEEEEEAEQEKAEEEQKAEEEEEEPEPELACHPNDLEGSWAQRRAIFLHKVEKAKNVDAKQEKEEKKQLKTMSITTTTTTTMTTTVTTTEKAEEAEQEEKAEQEEEEKEEEEEAEQEKAEEEQKAEEEEEEPKPELACHPNDLEGSWAQRRDILQNFQFVLGDVRHQHRTTGDMSEWFQCQNIDCTSIKSLHSKTNRYTIVVDPTDVGGNFPYCVRVDMTLPHVPETGPPRPSVVMSWD